MVSGDSEVALSRLRPVGPVTRRLLRMRRTHRMRQAHLAATPRATPAPEGPEPRCARSPDSPGTGRVDVFSATAGAVARPTAAAPRARRRRRRRRARRAPPRADPPPPPRPSPPPPPPPSPPRAAAAARAVASRHRAVAASPELPPVVAAAASPAVRAARRRARGAVRVRALAATCGEHNKLVRLLARAVLGAFGGGVGLRFAFGVDRTVAGVRRRAADRSRRWFFLPALESARARAASRTTPRARRC